MLLGGGPSASRWGFGGLECDGRVAPRFDGGSQDERFFGDARLDVSGGWMLVLGSKGKLRFGEFQTFLYRFFFSLSSNYGIHVFFSEC